MSLSKCSKYFSSHQGNFLNFFEGDMHQKRKVLVAWSLNSQNNSSRLKDLETDRLTKQRWLDFIISVTHNGIDSVTSWSNQLYCISHLAWLAELILSIKKQIQKVD